MSDVAMSALSGFARAASRVGVLAGLGLLVPLAQAQAAGGPATLQVEVNRRVHAVSPTLYGLMTEEINYSYDGGLYAELVRNRTFRGDWTGIPHWRLVELGNGSASVQVDPHDGPSTALPTSLKLEVKHADAANRAGVLNEGYWGMGVRPGSTFTGSLYAKADTPGSLPVRVAVVENQTGQELASATVDVRGMGWKPYAFSMKCGHVKMSAGNHLEVTLDRPATLRLQLVSLFPPTFHGRVHGNRVDLMEKLEAMHPAFLRMPGGNYVEGNTIAQRFDWKKTIGPWVDRPTHPSPWGYQSSDGMGLLEFLEWCEDLKMEPVLAVFAGYALQGEVVKAGPGLAPYVQDALDEIEYVTGGPETKWGAERGKDGHPAPFALRYVEIGNEDNFDKSGSYDARFAQFQKAIQAHYPKLLTIATTPVKGSVPDVVDDHYYLSAQEMFAKQTFYDTADRKGPKVFVGEWATREGAPTPNFGAALGDAAFMTGLERNSDLVVMASYAPLLVNINPGGSQWDTDLIGYDALSSYGSPSFYAQAMFSGCLGDHTVASTLSGAGDRVFTSVTASQHQLCVKLVNASSGAQPLALRLEDLGAGSHAVHVTTLHAESTEATNMMAMPEAIKPVSSSAAVRDGALSTVLPGYSIQVFQVDLP